MNNATTNWPNITHIRINRAGLVMAYEGSVYIRSFSLREAKDGFGTAWINEALKAPGQMTADVDEETS